MENKIYAKFKDDTEGWEGEKVWEIKEIKEIAYATFKSGESVPMSRLEILQDKERKELELKQLETQATHYWRRLLHLKIETKKTQKRIRKINKEIRKIKKEKTKEKE